MMIKTKLFLVSVFLFVAANSGAASEDSCLKRHGIIEFGSGSTKAFAAVVDVCEQKIKNILLEKRVAIAFNEALGKASDALLPESIYVEAEQKAGELVKELRTLELDRLQAVGTSVFRVAKNGRKFSQRFEKSLGVPFRILSQKQEAEAGYFSVLARRDQRQELLIVWDIGGGSMQMMSIAKGRQHLFEGQLASVTFKNEVLTRLKGQLPSEVSSPNPIGAYAASAKQIAKNHAHLNVPTWFKEQAKKARWVGIGGVLSGSVQQQSNPQSQKLTLEQIQEAYRKGVLKKDSEISSEYRVTDVSNLALVLGYMEALGVTEIETLATALGPGLVVVP